MGLIDTRARRVQPRRRTSRVTSPGAGHRARADLGEFERHARELHDAVAQTIFGVRLLAQSVGPAWRRDPAEGEARIERLLELTRTALVQLREYQRLG